MLLLGQIHDLLAAVGANQVRGFGSQRPRDRRRRDPETGGDLHNAHLVEARGAEAGHDKVCCGDSHSRQANVCKRDYLQTGGLLFIGSRLRRTVALAIIWLQWEPWKVRNVFRNMLTKSPPFADQPPMGLDVAHDPGLISYFA